LLLETENLLLSNKLTTKIGQLTDMKQQKRRINFMYSKEKQ